jgi:hypothetical protein
LSDDNTTESVSSSRGERLPVIVAAEAAEPPLLSLSLRVKFALTGIAFPIMCFIAPALGLSPSIDQPWQSGRMVDYLVLLLYWPSFGPLLPIIGYSMACMAAWLAYPEMSSQRWIRLGLYGGVVLAAQFLICVIVTSSITTVVIAAIVGPLLWLVFWGFNGLGRFARQFTIRHLLILTTLVAVMIPLGLKSGLIDPATDLPTIFGGLFFWIVAATPTLNLVTYVRASLGCFRLSAKEAGTNDSGDRRWLDPIGITIIASWFVVWLGSWRLAVQSMSREYSKLPTTDPNCYVSSAAACGHQELVGSEVVDGGCLNLQMQRLKALEWALAAGLPRCHRRVRQTYELFGPRLASVCNSSVWFADATYVILKPIEYSAVLIHLTAGLSADDVGNIYRRKSED